MFAAAESDEVRTGCNECSQVRGGRQLRRGINQHGKPMAVGNRGVLFERQCALIRSRLVIHCRSASGDGRLHLVGKSVVFKPNFDEFRAGGPNRMVIVVPVRAMHDEFVRHAGGIGQLVHAIHIQACQASCRSQGQRCRSAAGDNPGFGASGPRDDLAAGGLQFVHAHTAFARLAHASSTSAGSAQPPAFVLKLRPLINGRTPSFSYTCTLVLLGNRILLYIEHARGIRNGHVVNGVLWDPMCLEQRQKRAQQMRVALSTVG